MTELEYKELNNYLNDAFLELDEKNDSFLINNLEPVVRLKDLFCEISDEYEIKEDSKTNKLTYNDVYLLAREIIESIDKKYLEQYDKLIETGKLNFNYENDSKTGFINNSKISLIDIGREFNYSDVVKLVHEFFHYLNGSDYDYSVNRYVLSEFISIYFEMYAFDYLIDKGVPKEELNYNERLVEISKNSENFDSYGIVFLSYEKFGNINEKTVNDINKYMGYIDKEVFDECCKETLNKLKKPNNNNENYKYGFYLSKSITDEYRYILGTLFAIYARKYSDVDKMVYLNDTISKNYMDLNKIFKNIDIDTNDINFEENMVKCIEEYLSRFNRKKEKQ